VADHRWVQVFSASRPELIHPFTGLRPAQFHRLVRLVARRGDVVRERHSGPADDEEVSHHSPAD
jgi:hypothetical protein